MKDFIIKFLIYIGCALVTISLWMLAKNMGIVPKETPYWLCTTITCLVAQRFFKVWDNRNKNN